MSAEHPTPQDAEDAFYDAIDERDADALQAVWEDSADIACLLPMQPMVHGAEVHQAFRPLFEGEVKLEIQVRHIRWIEAGDLAIHMLEERVNVSGQPPQAPIYAVNTYRRGDSGWRLLMHQNSPTPPPPGAMAPGMVPGQGPAG
jgi:uncharacterized protein (TIGR02246 family)